MRQSQQQADLFARRAREHTIIIASGDRVRHFTFRPWMAVTAATVAAAFFLTYLGATAYLLFRDDLIGATVARQARMQHAYEDRIAALREQVDRVTSKQLLDQQLMEDKVDILLERQKTLTSRHGRLDALFERADTDLRQAADAPVPKPKPEQHASAETALEAISLLTGQPDVPEAAEPALAYAAVGNEIGTDRVLGEMSVSLGAIEQEQLRRAHRLTDEANRTSENIEAALREIDVPIPEQQADTSMGGPFLETDPVDFDAVLDELDLALKRLDAVREQARAMPLAHPAPGLLRTSRFGTRRDPFLKRAAFHSGIDFAIGIGEPVHATGAGTVVKAGRHGGYGNMVEIDHGSGIRTRFAHLSSISVTKGQSVSRGQTLGKAGSTGRSTGPHLHYEIRRNGRAVDPVPFIEAGTGVGTLLALK